MRLAVVCFLFAGCAAPSSNAGDEGAVGRVRMERGEHPFLLIERADFAALQAKAERSPWSEIAEIATARAAEERYRPAEEATVWGRQQRLRFVAGAAALAYIVEPEKRHEHAGTVVEALLGWKDLAERVGMEPKSWVVFAPHCSTYLTSVLAYDIVYDDVSEEFHGDIERSLRMGAEHIGQEGNRWRESRHAATGIWALFTGNWEAFEREAQRYRESWTRHITADGVYVPGSAYGLGRLAPKYNLGKGHFLDVLEYAGFRWFYEDRQFRSFVEWIYTGGLSPFRKSLSFGDSDIYGGWAHEPGSRLLSAGRFGEEIAGLVAWGLEETEKPFRDSSGDLLFTFLLADEHLPAPTPPASRLWPDGGAAFRESGGGDLGLMGALWNATTAEEHSHKDTNALHISGYGEHLLRNSGYAGWGKGVDETFDWKWINGDARSGNTLVIEGEDHRTKEGGGVRGGIVGSAAEYVEGHSGGALGDVEHRRFFTFVHPAGKAPGYFVVRDEVRGGSASGRATAIFHPDTEEIEAVETNRNYRADVRHMRTAGARLNLLIATPGADAEIVPAGRAAWDAGYVGEALHVSFALDERGSGTALFVLIPGAHDGIDPIFQIVNSPSVTGLRLDLPGDVQDLIGLRGDEITMLRLPGVAWDADAFVLRQQGGEFEFLLAQEAVRVEWAEGTPWRSEEPLGVFPDGDGITVSAVESPTSQ